VEGFMDREVLDKEVGTEGLQNYWGPADMDWLQCGAVWFLVNGHGASGLVQEEQHLLASEALH
jgi:hypothetical protein